VLPISSIRAPSFINISPFCPNNKFNDAVSGKTFQVFDSLSRFEQTRKIWVVTYSCGAIL
jgi:hypothetical protein